MPFSGSDDPQISLLYVDDEPALLEIGKAFLERSAGILVDTHETAIDALRILETQSYDAIVSDYQMPDMDGIAFLKALKEKGDTTPFIIFTGKGREDVVIEAFEAGADFYIQKGGDPRSQFAELERKVRRAVDLHRAERATRESEEKYRTLVDRANQMLFLHDQHGAILDVNQKAIESTGYSREELLSMNVTDIDPDVDQHSFTQWLWQEAPLLEEKTFETRHRRKDGSIYPAEVHASRVTIAGEPCILGLATDITSRREREAALRESEERFRGIIDNLQDIYYRTDTRGIVTMLSLSAAGVFGYDSTDAIIKKPASDFWAYPEERKEIVRRIAEEGRVQDYEVTLKKADGSLLPVSVSCRQLYDNSGKPAGIEGVIRDITLRKEAEERLRESEEKYRLIADNTADNIWIFDMDFLIRYISPSVQRMKGFTVEESLAQTIEEKLTPSSYAALLDRFNEEMEAEASGTADPDRTVSFETEEYCKDGSTILVENSARLLRDEEGKPVGILGISRDITKRKEMERALQSQLDLIERLFESLPLGVLIFDTSGTILLMNRGIEEITGYMPEEIPTLHEWFLRAYPDPAYRNEVIETWDNDRTGKTTTAREFKVTCKDGTVKDIEFHAAFLADGRIIVTISDVTQRRNAEDALRQSEAEKGVLLNAIPVMLAYYDTDLRVLYANQVSGDSVGERPEDLAGRHCYEIWHNRTEPCQDCPVLRSMTTKRIEEGEVTVPDGRIFMIRGCPVHDKEGEISGLLEFGMDITERKQADFDLAAAQQRLKEAHQLANIGVWDWVMATDSMTWSEELYAIAGRDPALPALNYLEHQPLYTPASWDRLKPAIHTTLETGEPFSLELEMVRPDGSIRNVHALGRQSLDINGNCIGLHGAVQDITERKLAEDALQTANRKLQILSSITRHDIQNKIMVLQAYLDLTRPEIADPKLSKYLSEVDRAGNEIQRQIEFTRTYEELGVERAAWHAIEDLLSPISDSTLPVHADCIGYRVLADPMIQKVFFNLMDNTIRYAEGASRVECRCEEREGRLAIIWEDDGAGVPDDQKERIFERGVGRHTGFGLFLSREILAITGITIEETGEYGKGARFEMLVPAGAWQKSDGDI